MHQTAIANAWGETLMGKIVLEGVSKVFKDKQSPAVDDLNLEVEDGEFLVMVGPSGCGKTTTLRMIAGFEVPTAGVVRIGGKPVNNIWPKDRNLAMVFQNYALFPHMTIVKNLAFGMKARGESRPTIAREIEKVAGMLGIDSLLGRKPGELSGGERQRVALGRALLRRPEAFLLDEPLSNLDAALRAQMRLELKRIHAQFPVTTVYVTHDQVEAMTMADRIALMSHGQLQQTASPEHIYDHPANAFVASFIGSPKINFFQGTLVRDGGTPRVTFLDCSLDLPGGVGDAVERLAHSSVTVGFRPEEIRLAPAAGGRLPAAKCVVELVEPLGPETNLVVRSGEETWVCKVRARSGLAVGDVVTLEFDTSQVKLFDTESGERLN
jgi:multiple sugar transport system ATP-binding protein